jgi:hypothetical protein
LAWLKVDDRFPSHPKVVRAGLGGWLALCGICYCRAHLTDGFIPREAVPTLAPGLTRALHHAARLVALGLWHEHPDGYLVHDFLEWNPSRADVLSHRDMERDKKRTQRGQSGDTRGRARASAGVRGSPSLSASSGSTDGSDLDPDKDAALSPVGLAELWNTRTTPPLPRCLIPMSGARQGRARARLREHPQPEYWQTVLDGIEASAWCRGENDRGWRASFDWLLQADVGAKVLEGKYARCASRPSPATTKGQRTIDGMREVLDAWDDAEREPESPGDREVARVARGGSTRRTEP